MADSNSSLKHKTLSGVVWQLAQKGATQIVTFAVSVILARLIDPTEFGIVAMTSIFMSIASVLSNCGLGASLVQKKTIDDLDKDTAFFAGLVLSSFLFLVLYFCAPLISRMYDEQILTSIIRIAAISLFAGCFNSVQGAIVMRTLDFKKYFYANLSATILSAVVGITMAYKGFGVWALVFQNLVKSIGGVFVLFTLVRWFPKLKFSWTRLKGLFSFGLNLTAANLIGSIFNELRGFLIGLNFQPADLAYFNRGNSIPGIINDNINGTISGVLFPAMSRLQEDKAAVKNALRRSMMTSVYIMAPLMVLLAVTSKQLILLLYTDKWIQAVPFMQVAVFYHLFSILGLANLQALNAIGRSDITIKLEFIKKPILMVILLFTCKISPLALSVGTAIYAIIGAAINAQPNKKQISYSYKEQLADTLPQITIALAASSVAYAIGLFHLNLYIQLFLQYVIGIGAYLFLTKLLRLESMNYTFTTIRDYFSSLQS